MDIYEATQTLLMTIAPDLNVSAYVLQYDENLDKYLLPDFPALTYNYENVAPVVSFDGDSNLYRITLNVEVWGDLEQIASNSKKVSEALNAKRVTVGNVEFTLIVNESRDIAELGLDFKRRRMRFVGLADVGETHGETSL